MRRAERLAISVPPSSAFVGKQTDQNTFSRIGQQLEPRLLEYAVPQRQLVPVCARQMRVGGGPQTTMHTVYANSRPAWSMALFSQCDESNFAFAGGSRTDAGSCSGRPACRCRHLLGRLGRSRVGFRPGLFRDVRAYLLRGMTRAAQASFDRLLYSHRQRQVLAVEAAENPEAPQRRIEKSI
jgi:hypothetical protein